VQPDLKRHHLTKNVTFVYETDSLNNASPAAINNMVKLICNFKNSARLWSQTFRKRV